jgi:uncharacterized protein involved in exopolysaccharide biosynthesis
MSTVVTRGGLSAATTTLRRRWHVALTAFALPLATAGGLVAFLPGVYQGRAVVIVDPGAGVGASIEDTEVRLSQLTNENLGRAHLLELAQGGGGGEAAAQALRRDVDVETQRVDSAGKATSIAVTVTARGPDPDRVARLANALAIYYVDAERDHLRTRAATVDKQVEELRARFNGEQDKVAAYQASHLRELPEAVGVHMASVEGLTAQLEMIDFNRSRALEHARTLVHRPAITPGAKGGPDDADPEAGRLRQALRDLRTRYSDEHPDVLRVRRELEAVEKQRAAAPPPPPASAAPRDPAAEMQDVEAELRAATRAEQGLKGQIAGALHSAFNAPRRGQELAALLPRYEAARAEYQAVLKQQEELRVLRGERGDGCPFHVVEDATVPRQPIGPDRTRLAALGLIVALLAAVAATWLAEQTDHTVHGVGDLRALVRIPVLATIPRLTTLRDLRRTRWRAALFVVLLLALIAAVLIAAAQVARESDALLHLLVRKGAP